MISSFRLRRSGGITPLTLVLVANLLVLTIFSGACSDSDRPDVGHRPLQPLIYTEYPGLTPEGAAVRERRLTRQLLEGIADGDWGTLDDDHRRHVDPLLDPQQLGQAITEALLSQDERLWEYVFVSDDAYARLVNVSPAEAQEFVDNQIGGSLPTWELFGRTHSSELPEGGLREQLEFDSLELGRPRDIHGSLTENDEEIVQFWGNRLIIRHADADLSFELPISRIFRLHAPSDPSPSDEEELPLDLQDGDEQGVENSSGHRYHLASEIELSSRLETFLDVGLHLKPQLLRAEEYPFPLGVGTFWRYSRYDAARGRADDDDPLARRFDERPDGLHAEQVIVEVREVSNYGPVRLVELLRSYDDRDHTRVREWWVLTPRRIYLCDAFCRDNITDLGALLGYFSGQTPLLRFPLRLGVGWGPSGELDDDGGTFSVDDQWHQVSTPAGTFAASFRIAGAGPLARPNPYFRNVQLLRDFAPRRGVVRRQIFAGEGALEGVDVVEELVEYRIMH